MTDRDSTNHADEFDVTGGDQVDPGWPWSFILLVVAGALYLIFRFVEVAINILT